MNEIEQAIEYLSVCIDTANEFLETYEVDEATTKRMNEQNALQKIAIKALEKQKEYEDLEEQGRLIRVPEWPIPISAKPTKCEYVSHLTPTFVKVEKCENCGIEFEWGEKEMKAYICDSCGRTINNPYKEKMKEFYVEYFRLEISRKVKIHLCNDCFRGLNKIAENAEAHHEQT